MIFNTCLRPSLYSTMCIFAQMEPFEGYLLEFQIVQMGLKKEKSCWVVRMMIIYSDFTLHGFEPSYNLFTTKQLSTIVFLFLLQLHSIRDSKPANHKRQLWTAGFKSSWYILSTFGITFAITIYNKTKVYSIESSSTLKKKF